MYGMKIDVIYSKHESLVFRSRCLVAPMAFKREVILRVFLFDVLYSYATFYAAHSEAGAIGETGNYACLPF